MILLSTAGGGYPFLLMMGAMFIVMYFFMIRPQIKKQKKELEYRAALKKGDKVVFGGIHGKITDIKENFFIVEAYAGTTLKVEKSAVSMSEEAISEKK
jgi:preprotein translocase subunit YajC